MKWIGQYIQNFKATFRQDVTLDSTLTFDSVGLTAVQTSSESFADNDTSIMTSAAIDDRINTAVTAEDLDVSADSGTAAVDLDSQSLAIRGGTNATSSATGQSVTINVDDAFLINDGHDTTTGVITAGGFTTTGTITMPELTDDAAIGITKIQDSGTSFTDNDTSIMTAAAVDDRILDYGYGTGDITGVTLTADDEEVASDTAGSADFTIAGGKGIDTTSDGSSTITISGEDASDSNAGVVELATTAETNTGTDTGRAVTPAGLTAWTGDTALVTVGTIGTGTWEGTAVATDQQKHLAWLRFMGYSVGDGSNYELGQAFTDAQSPWEHAYTTSSDGLTIPASAGTNVSDLLRSGGHVVTTACTLKKWTGWATYNGGDDAFVSIFKWTPADNDNTAITPTLLDTVTINGTSSNDKARTFAETGFNQASVSAGDIIFTQIKTETNNKHVYFNSTLEVEF